MEILYAYVDGSDLHEVANTIRERLHAFSSAWSVPDVSVVENKAGVTSDLQPGDLPDWQLGLNIQLTSIPRKKVLELVGYLSKLAAETEREFAIGSYSTDTMIAEDWCYIDSNPKQSDVDMLVEQLA